MSRDLIVHNPGLLSLVQDAGRTGFQRYGVSVSGAVDREALLIGNLLLSNDPGAAGIEVTFGGAEFEFTLDSIVAITGGDLQPTLDNTPISQWESFYAPGGSTLRMTGPANGMRSYITIAGGIDTSPVLGSRSTHVSSGFGAPLKAGDRLPLGDCSEEVRPGAKLPVELEPRYENELTVRVVPGPQHDQFTSAGLQTFYSSVYTVTESSDRQGLRLDGPGIESRDSRYDIVSDAVLSGAIQVPGDGKPIVLLADSQTTGGYAKIGVVATVDLPLLAQAPPGTTVRFAETTVSQAQLLLRERMDSLHSADLFSDLRDTRTAISVDGEPTEVRVSYRTADASLPQGAMASLELNGVRSTIRIEEIE